jgi:hypothetical protein
VNLQTVLGFLFFKRIRKPKNQTPVSNPQEAIDRMIQEKKLSSKINYDVLKNIKKDLVGTRHNSAQIELFLIFFNLLFQKKPNV